MIGLYTTQTAETPSKMLKKSEKVERSLQVNQEETVALKNDCVTLNIEDDNKNRPCLETELKLVDKCASCGNSQKQHKNHSKGTSQNRKNKEPIIWKNMSKFTVWTISFCAFAYFMYNCSLEYLENNLVSITSHRMFLDGEALVAVSVCNNMALDPELLDAYKKSSPDNLTFIYDPVKSFYAMDSERLKSMKLNLDKFLVGCEVYPHLKSCFNYFKLQLETTALCYKAFFNMKGIGSINQIIMDFYFDPSLHKESVSNPGVFVSIYHPEGYMPPVEGFFLGPKQIASVSIEIVHKTQKKSFPKATCVHRYFKDIYTFTGKPFETDYNTESCFDLCRAEWEYKRCNCSIIVGWNITNTRCLDDKQIIRCLVDFSYDQDTLHKMYKTCITKCVDKCNRKMVEYQGC